MVEASARTPERAGRGPCRSAPREAVTTAPAAPSCSSSSLLPAVPTTLTSGSREARLNSRLHPRPGHPVSTEPQATLGLSLPVGRQSGSYSRLTEAKSEAGEGGSGALARAPWTARAPLHPRRAYPGARQEGPQGGLRRTWVSYETGGYPRRFPGRPLGRSRWRS